MKGMQKLVNSISDAETEILKQLWDCSPLSAQDIISRMQGNQSTVKTLINRLLKKGALSFKEQDRKYLYSPLVNKAEFYKEKSNTFLEKYFGGEVLPMISFFTNQKTLDEKELQELKQLVAQMEADLES